ncbi:MAG: MFS transporter [Gammaproteobacteria bacterium]|nr:MFS transporter [Gammaproteobacteria bacterium]
MPTASWIAPQQSGAGWSWARLGDFATPTALFRLVSRMPKTTATESGQAYPWYVVVVLTFAFTVAFIDRQILSLLVEPIQRDLGITDTQISLLAGFAFAVFYSVLGVPIAWLADRYSRRAIISIGVFLWSLMTAACGLARTFAGLFIFRVGVGVGEAALSPAAYSIIADYFPPQKLAKAIAVYAMGLYLGAGLAMIAGSVAVRLVSGVGVVELPLVGELFPWQLTFLIVALPGVLVLLGMATVREPQRRVSTAVEAGGSSRELLAFFRTHRRFLLAHFAGFGLLGTVVTAFMVWTPEFLRRNHGFEIADAGLIYGIILMCFGLAGPYAGGWLATHLARKGRRDAELRASVLGGLAITPLTLVAPLAPGPVSAVLLLAVVTFALSFPQALPPTMLQLVAPSHLRARVTAIFMLVSVLSAYSIGPILVALLNDQVFQDKAALPYSLAIVGAVLSPLGTACLYFGLKPYRAALAPRNGFDGADY